VVVGRLRARGRTMLSDVGGFIYKAGPFGLMFKKNYARLLHLYHIVLHTFLPKMLHTSKGIFNVAIQNNDLNGLIISFWVGRWNDFRWLSDPAKTSRPAT
jgi:hypothetical protein